MSGKLLVDMNLPPGSPAGLPGRPCSEEGNSIVAGAALPLSATVRFIHAFR